MIERRNDVADVAWGLGFVPMAWVSFPLSDDSGKLGFLAGILVSVWGLRLASYIYPRSKNKTEDYRYLAWRKELGKWFYIRSYFQVYLFQGVCLFLTDMPVLVINKNARARLRSLNLCRRSSLAYRFLLLIAN